MEEHPEQQWLDSIICGDALATLRAMPIEQVQLIVTAPPFDLVRPNQETDVSYEEYIEWMDQVWDAASRVLVSGGRLCVNVGESKFGGRPQPTYSTFIDQILALEVKMLYRGTVILQKARLRSRNTPAPWQVYSNPEINAQHEYIVIFSKDNFKLEGRKEDVTISADEFMDTTRSVWQLGTQAGKRIGHPAPFPEALPERLIKYYSYKGNTVLDMFGGSGTVGVVAKRLGRRFVLIDNSKKYCELAQKRFKGEFKEAPEILTSI